MTGMLYMLYVAAAFAAVAADMWSRGCYAPHNICSLSKWLNTPGMLTYFAAFPALANLHQLTTSPGAKGTGGGFLPTCKVNTQHGSTTGLMTTLLPSTLLSS